MAGVINATAEFLPLPSGINAEDKEINAFFDDWDQFYAQINIKVREGRRTILETLIMGSENFKVLSDLTRIHSAFTSEYNVEQATYMGHEALRIFPLQEIQRPIRFMEETYARLQGQFEELKEMRNMTQNTTLGLEILSSVYLEKLMESMGFKL